MKTAARASIAGQQVLVLDDEHSAAITAAQASSAGLAVGSKDRSGVLGCDKSGKAASDDVYFGRHNGGFFTVLFSYGRWRLPTLVAILAFLLASSSARAAFFNNYDHESRAWRTNVLTVGVLSGNCYVAATRFMLQTRAAGLRSSIYRLNLFAGPNTNACRKPIIALLNGTAGESASDFLTGTNENSYSEANGVVFAAGGTSMYATGFNPTNLPLNSAHLAIYLGGTPGQNGNVDIGAQNFPTLQFFSMVTGFTTTGESVNIWTNGGFTGFANTNGTGYFMGSRTSSATTGVKMYRFGVLDATSTAVGSSPPNTAGSASAGMYVLGLNSGGSPILASSRIGRGYQIGLGFDATQAASSAKIWQRFETTLGRAVVPY